MTHTLRKWLWTSTILTKSSYMMRAQVGGHHDLKKELLKQAVLCCASHRSLSDHRDDIEIAAGQGSGHMNKVEAERAMEGETASAEKRQTKKGKKFVKPAESAQYFESKWLQSHRSNVSSTDWNTNNRSTVPSGQIQQEKKDSFGTLSNENASKDQRHPNERLPEEFPENREKARDFRSGIPLTRHGRTGRTAFYYTNQMSKLGKEGKIREAIAVYDDLMMKRDRVLPRKRTFITLIGILGRVGYTRKAFQLFRQMRMLGFDVDDHIYTSLFNACANCPSPEEGLARAEKLIRYLQENQIKPNLYTVKSCMKALALCGDFPRAFAVLDEAANRMKLDSECFNSLLISCVSDKSAGFLRALLVWQKMREMRIQPQTNTFNLFLRCVRDCGIGDPNTFQQLLGMTRGEIEMLSLESGLVSPPPQLPSAGKSSPNIHKGRKKKVLYEGHGDRWQSYHLGLEKDGCEDTKSISKHAEYNVEKALKTGRDPTLSFKHETDEEGCPSEWWEAEFLSDSVQESESNDIERSVEVRASSTPSSTIDNQGGGGSANISVAAIDNVQQTYTKVTDLKRSEGRLAVVGGATHFLSHMRDCGAPPDIKTVTQILGCIRNDESSEISLLQSMQEVGIKPDTDFLNDIMMRRYRRQDHNAVRAVLVKMSEFQLIPNMRTYAALALTCNLRDKGVQLLKDMENAGVEPTVEVMSHLLMASYTNFAYKLDMLKTLETLGHKPTTRILTHIEKCIASAKGKIAEAERSNDINSFYLSDTYIIPLRNFLVYYRQWLQRTDIDRPEHPWKAFEPVEEEEEQQLEKNS